MQWNRDEACAGEPEEARLSELEQRTLSSYTAEGGWYDELTRPVMELCAWMLYLAPDGRLRWDSRG